MSPKTASGVGSREFGCCRSTTRSTTLPPTWPWWPVGGHPVAGGVEELGVGTRRGSGCIAPPISTDPDLIVTTVAADRTMMRDRHCSPQNARRDVAVLSVVCVAEGCGCVARGGAAGVHGGPTRTAKGWRSRSDVDGAYSWVPLLTLFYQHFPRPVGGRHNSHLISLRCIGLMSLPKAKAALPASQVLDDGEPEGMPIAYRLKSEGS